jgi:hypothetical protein
MFWLAPFDAAGDEYYFDNVVLTKTSSSVVAASASEAPTAVEPARDMMPEAAPTVLQLHESYPNPFNPTTTIAFDLPAYAYVRLNVYDVLGREVETLLEGARNPGAYRIVWDAQNQSSGVYFCRLQVEPAGPGQSGIVFSRKLVLAR